MNKVSVKTDYVFNKNAKDKVIYHIADIHFNEHTKESLFRKLLDSVYEIKPDYIMITGDLIDRPLITKDRIKIKRFVNFLSQLGELSKVIISIGNHDAACQDDLKFFKKINELRNIYVLDNTNYEDEFIYVYGITLPSEYYYNMTGKEDYNVLLKVLRKNKKYINKIPNNLVHIFLCHSPICLTNNEVRNELNEFDLLLSGHMHNGLVPPFISSFGGNWGFVGPSFKLFPRVCRGRINHDDKSLIINGGVTKLSPKSVKVLSSFNFCYNIDVNKIILTRKKGRFYGKN